jgi:hypothetical protein
MKKDYKKAYKALQEYFEQYQRESIKWGVEDFICFEKEGWQINEEQAQDALEHMIRKADCSIGVTWDTVDYYYEFYGEKVEIGTELWRKEK